MQDFKNVFAIVLAIKPDPSNIKKHQPSKRKQYFYLQNQVTSSALLVKR